MANETFVPQGTLFPDYGAGANWSGGTVPGIGTIAVIENITAMVNPETTLSAHIVLRGDAALSGNDGGFSLGVGSAIQVEGDDALYGDGAIVNHGAISLVGGTVSLRVVVEDASGVAQSYGLNLPSFENAGRMQVSDGATLAVDGTEFSNTGDITVDAGSLLVAGGGVDGGQEAAPPGGDITLTDGGFASFSDAVAYQNISFVGSGTLSFGDVADAENISIYGFSTSAAILVPSVAAGNELLQKLNFVGGQKNYVPAVVPTATGAVIELQAAQPCFARGTGILTPLGYVPVERLKPGDPVVTLGGAVRAVRWVGARTVDIAAHRRPEAVRPVRILAGAFSPGVPARGLRLSPDHALLLGGQLVPVKLLVNGATILRDIECQAVTYLHVELDRHEILLAENLAVESYLDTGNREMFENALGPARNNPVFGRGRQWNRRAYADLCLSGPALRAARRGIRARALEIGFSLRTLTEISLWVGGKKYFRAEGTVERPVFRFATPHPGLVTIRSPHFVPAEFSSGADDEEDDYRTLGIAISRITLGRKRTIARDIAVSGFHLRGAKDAADWTDGNAVIAVPKKLASIGLSIAALPQGWLRL